MPADIPGASVPLLLTSPTTVPVPPSLAPTLTVTGPVPVPLPVVFVTTSVPPLIVVPPVYVFALSERECSATVLRQTGGARRGRTDRCRDARIDRDRRTGERDG